jgi:hypothetical protein
MATAAFLGSVRSGLDTAFVPPVPASTAEELTAASLRECPQEPSRYFLDRFSCWSGGRLADVSAAVLACRHYWATLGQFWDLSKDPHMPPAALEKLDKRLTKDREKALRKLEPIIEAGLLAREGKRLLPDGIPPLYATERHADWLAWRAIETCLASLEVEIRGLCVCGSCTLVFRQQRKGSTRYCPVCAKRRAPAPLSAKGQRAGRPGRFRRGQGTRAQASERSGRKRAPLRVAPTGVPGGSEKSSPRRAGKKRLAGAKRDARSPGN